ncbi:MAG: DUF1343 domain-containing protein [bacterium]|nr:DUF1343 domain-containing protein [bacterium]
MDHVTTGLEVLCESPELVAGRPSALLANHAAVTRKLEPARTALMGSGVGSLIKLFAPEHGLEGVAQDMETVEHAEDPLTGLPVISLYGSEARSLAPTREALKGVEVLIVDVPDIGTRYYTFAASLDAAMAVCEHTGVEVIVLDRPNPLGGVLREGGMVRRGFESFVSQVPTPVRHGMTLGEIALLLQSQRYPNLELMVAPCRGWRRQSWINETHLQWVPPSPNMPTLDTATIYPGMCLIEATTLSEGRGTTRPFHLVGAPWIDGGVLTERLRTLAIPGIGFRAATFRPMFGKHAGEVCSGIELFVLDREVLRPLELGLLVLKTIIGLYPESFRWRAEPYEFVSNREAIDILTGSEQAREILEHSQPLEPLLEQWKGEVEEFENRLEGIMLYRDF